MKKILGFIVSLIMIFSVGGCVNNNTNSLMSNSDCYNSAIDTDINSKETSYDSSTEIEDDNSSSNGNGNKPSNETEGWTDFF